MTLRILIDQALHDCKKQLMGEKSRYSRTEYKSIMGTIPLLRNHLRQAYRSYKGMTYLEVRARLIADSRQYYGECVAEYLDKTLPALVGEEGDVVDRMWQKDSTT